MNFKNILDGQGYENDLAYVQANTISVQFLVCGNHCRDKLKSCITLIIAMHIYVCV